MKKEENKVADKPYAKAGGGFSYEQKVQAYLTVLMLTKTPFHFLSPWCIEEIQFQTEWREHDTDDLAVIFSNLDSDNAEKRKALVEIKSSIRCTEKDRGFVSVIENAWNDFNNSEIFEKEKDVIVLITGLLNAGDHKSFTRFIDNVKYVKNYEEFCEKKKSFSNPALKKHEAIKAILIAHIESPKENTDGTVSQKLLDEKAKESLDKEIYDFYRHFFIYQLEFGNEMGLGPIDGLIMNLVSDYQSEKPQQLWSRVVLAMQDWNKNSGTAAKSSGPIGFGSLPDDIKADFSQKVFYDRSLVSHVGAQIKKLQTESVIFLARAALIGSWSDQNEHDQAIVAKSLKKDGNYAVCGEGAQKISSLPLGNMLLVYKGNAWQVKNRDEIMQSVGKRFIDSDIDIFKDCAINVLEEKDPAWNFPLEERQIASIFVAPLKHSQSLRHGLVEGLAILAKNSDALEKCQPDKGKNVAEEVVWKIFSNASADVWASMNDLLPKFAEAAPEQFLKMVRNALNQSHCPFDELFAHEGDEITRKSYVIGIIEAMGRLASNKKCLVGACMVLGKMAYRESSSQRENRPLNLLINVLFPSMAIPKPIHSWEQRKIAAKSLLREFPDVALELFLELLPKERLVFSTEKPKARTVSEERVLRKQYIEEVRFYSELIIKAAGNDISRLTMIAKNLVYLPENLFNEFAEIFKSPSIIELSEEERAPLWREIMQFEGDRRLQNRNEQQIARIGEIVALLAPKSPFYLHQRIFGSNEYRLLDGKGEHREQYARLHKARDEAIVELLDEGGVEGVIRFIKETAVSPDSVGCALGSIDGDVEKIERYILPSFLDNSDRKFESLARGFVLRKFRDEGAGSEWFGCIDKSNWTPTQVGCFLSFLPLTQKNWELAFELLGKDEKEYWSRVGKINLYWHLGKDNMPHAVKMLIEHGNSPVAAQLLCYMLRNEGKIDVAQCIEALKSLYRLDINLDRNTIEMLQYDIGKLIAFLQSNDSVNVNDMIDIEWVYLKILDTPPKHLEKEMACNSKFFCEVVQTAIPLKEDDKKRGEHDRVLMSKAFELLNNWKTIPGFNYPDVMDTGAFKNWVLGVKENCKKDFYWKVSLEYIGSVLMRSPKDPDGLWINRSVAEILNEDSNDADVMRDGFNRGFYNSRGTHWVDPTGEQERKLAEAFQNKADQLEKAGFSLFAEGVRKLASDYEKERKRVIDSEKNRND